MQRADSHTCTSVIDEELTPVERNVLAAYRSAAASDVRRQIRLSAQYALCTGLFVYLSLSSGQPLYGLVVYAVFLVWMAARLFGASRIAGVMPSIIEKYEARIGALKLELARLGEDDDATPGA